VEPKRATDSRKPARGLHLGIFKVNFFPVAIERQGGLRDCYRPQYELPVTAGVGNRDEREFTTMEEVVPDAANRRLMPMNSVCGTGGQKLIPAPPFNFIDFVPKVE
jgi:hypothetical protein